MAVCSECNNKVDRNDESKMECVLCKKLFHAKCVDMEPADVEYFKIEKLSFKCSYCVNKRKSAAAINSPPLTPYRNLDSVNKSDGVNAISLKLPDTISDCVDDKLNAILKCIEDTKTFFLSKFDDIQSELASVVHNLTAENKMLKSQIRVLSSRVDNLEQSSLNNCVDIVGVPYNEDKNKLRESILNVFCKNIKANISNDNIIDLYQKNITKPNKNNIKNVVCVKFDSSESKYEIMKSKKKLYDNAIIFKNENDEEVSEIVYINHSLINNKRKILKAATNVKKEFNFKFLWIKNGNIYLRKKEGSEVKIINCLEDLEDKQLLAS